MFRLERRNVQRADLMTHKVYQEEMPKILIGTWSIYELYSKFFTGLEEFFASTKCSKKYKDNRR